MEELKRIQEETDKVTDIQKKYNVNSKNFAYILGKNLTLFLCMMVPVLMVAFIWTDFAAVVIGPKMFSDGILTVTLFTVGEIVMTMLGADGGRMDSEFISAKAEYDLLRSQVGEIGTLLMGIFCDWQIDVELAQAVQHRIRVLRITPQKWEEIKDCSPKELEEKFGKKKAKKIMEIINLKPIELNEAILLYNGSNATRGGVPISGDEFLKSKKHMIEMLLACIFTGLLTVTVVVTLTDDISLARIIYTAFKLMMLLFRMCKGYSRGAKAYNTVEVRQLKAKSNYLRQYIKFVDEKIYIKIGDQYGDISQFVSDENDRECGQNIAKEAVT